MKSHLSLSARLYLSFGNANLDEDFEITYGEFQQTFEEYKYENSDINMNNYKLTAIF